VHGPLDYCRRVKRARLNPALAGVLSAGPLGQLHLAEQNNERNSEKWKDAVETKVASISTPCNVLGGIDHLCAHNADDEGNLVRWLLD
jgi:hypothetical protein